MNSSFGSCNWKWVSLIEGVNEFERVQRFIFLLLFNSFSF